MSAKAVADNGDFLAIATADFEDITTQAANDLDSDLVAGACDPEGVIALQGIDGEFLDSSEGDEEASAIDAVGGDDEVVAELGTDDRSGCRSHRRRRCVPERSP